MTKHIEKLSLKCVKTTSTIQHRILFTS